ncbi:MAG: (d)CMP kinase [Thermodesulfobacteriota bacterium]|nr:(d)CMP kinase [Thermodesulfobacteriota bacterium]
MEKRLVITVDGPAGAGKSTVSKILARKLSYIYLDTGALYRAFACKVAEEGIPADDEKRLSGLCAGINVSLKSVNSNISILVDDEDVTEKIRTQEIGMLASKVSAVPVVRKTLLSIQRETGKNGGIVAEGRDMGTVVFPDADFKFFLNASVSERSRRRFTELVEKGESANFEEVKRGLIMRDRQDSEREIAPLKPSKDSVVIDSTGMSITNVVEKMMKVIKKNSIFR